MACAGVRRAAMHDRTMPHGAMPICRRICWAIWLAAPIRLKSARAGRMRARRIAAMPQYPIK
ncbi:hypothetical protein WS67_07455 [Burkholderia singularis]|uniref:Uncharacterized protein n=1 Tax=Burkholderia singularis TaxID=1503053 RepID=A0A103E563_9BURK|nr:hypothetical protein WS67_07455 [Burkholderia singularis]